MLFIYYAPTPNRWGHKEMMLSDVCLLGILGLSREQRGLGRLKLAQR